MIHSLNELNSGQCTTQTEKIVKTIEERLNIDIPDGHTDIYLDTAGTMLIEVDEPGNKLFTMSIHGNGEVSLYSGETGGEISFAPDLLDGIKSFVANEFNTLLEEKKRTGESYVLGTGTIG